jgi:GLPGLI family protein
MNLKVGTKLLFIWALLFLVSPVFSQYATSGKITFERRTNLEKRYTDKRMKRMINETNKIRTEKFELLFNDTCSIFKAIPEQGTSDQMSWMTSKNTYYQQLQKKSQLTILAVFGQNIYILDSLPSRQWKITDNKRVISGYDCRKAIYQKNDSTRIYAWYTSALIPSVGPEGFCGLPGTILGLASEDGGIIYFAKNVELIKPKKEDLVLPIGKNKVFTLDELRLKIEKEYGNTRWGKGMFDELFRWL